MYLNVLKSKYDSPLSYGKTILFAYLKASLISLKYSSPSAFCDLIYLSFVSLSLKTAFNIALMW
ncbi:Uncharacterised protein, partial [Mycoplasmopsis edwardii]